jgi:hypothetical protein
MELKFKVLRFVADKPAASRFPWIFLEWARPTGKTSYRLFISSAFTGWGLRLANCGDGSVPAPVGIAKHL